MKQVTIFLLVTLLAAASALASDIEYVHKVTITNVTRGQTFTPILVTSHRSRITLFETGAPANPEITAMAESGDIGPLMTLLGSYPGVYDIADSGGLLLPGESVTVTVASRGRSDRISLVGMLIPTNDSFVALSNVRAPHNRWPVRFDAPAYDAGTETNDELCASIPGPVCGGAALSPNDDGEGYVHISAGIFGSGDLPEVADRDWRNPVAQVSVRRVQK
jgi:hypothetical protein